ncbi:MAG: hypothetical protein AABZ47_02575 [Planctomycetota bacterium]
MDRAHAWQLFPLLVSSPVTTSPLFGLRSALTNFLGPESSIRIDELAEAELGILSTSWKHLGESVWLVRVHPNGVIDRWFPKDRRLSEEVTPIPFFQTQDGLAVGIQQDMVFMAKRGRGEPLLRQILSSTLEPKLQVLGNTDIFKELSSQLPPKPLVVAYIDSNRKGSTPSETFPSILPAVDRSLVGMYESAGQIEFAIRSQLNEPSRQAALSPSDLETMLSLPRTTLLALVTNFNIEGALATATESLSPPGTMGRYLTFLRGLTERSSPSENLADITGSTAIVAWGQDVSEHGLTPQVAILTPCRDSTALLREVRESAEGLIRLIRSLDPSGEIESHPLKIVETSRLGAPVYSISLRGYAEKSRLPIVRLLGGIEPAWTVSEGWFMLALTRDHLHRILDARHGLVATLQSLPEARDLHRVDSPRGMIGFLQAGLASDLLARWLRDFETGSPSLLDPTWWSVPQNTEATQRNVGIGMQASQEPGVVIVAKIHRNSRADGILRIGDRVLGVDGQLLNLIAPNADLRRRLGEGPNQPNHVLRLLRGGQLIEVKLPTISTSRGVRAMGPAELIRELASLSKSLQSATYTVNVTDESRYSAQLSLRFAPSAKP